MFIVIHSHGENEDYREDPIVCTTDVDKANKYAEDLTQKLDSILENTKKLECHMIEWTKENPRPRTTEGYSAWIKERWTEQDEFMSANFTKEEKRDIDRAYKDSVWFVIEIPEI